MLSNRKNNIDESFSFAQGHYVCKNWMMEKTGIYFKPFGYKWMFEAKLRNKETLFFVVKWYVRIEDTRYNKRRS